MEGQRVWRSGASDTGRRPPTPIASTWRKQPVKGIGPPGQPFQPWVAQRPGVLDLHVRALLVLRNAQHDGAACGAAHRVLLERRSIDGQHARARPQPGGEGAAVPGHRAHHAVGACRQSDRVGEIGNARFFFAGTERRRWRVRVDKRPTVLGQAARSVQFVVGIDPSALEACPVRWRHCLQRGADVLERIGTRGRVRRGAGESAGVR